MRFAAVAVTVTLALTAACSSEPTMEPAATSCRADDGVADGTVAGDGPLRVVTTVSPITSIVATVAAGTDVEIVGIVPEGINSHTYEPTPSAASELERADVVFLNGLDLEVPTERLAAANVGSDVIVCGLGDEILPVDDYIYDFSFPESAGSPNPHLWTNPPMARAYAAVVGDVLSALDPGHAATFEANEAAFAEQVDELDAAVREATASLPPEDRLLLTYHDAYAYFADEYGWEVIGAVQPSSFDDPTPREVAAVIEQVRETGVAAIFGSEVFPSPVLRQIADETGVTYVDDLRDDDLPGEPGDPQHSWMGLMRGNLITIVTALGGDASAIEAIDATTAAVDTARYAP